MGLMRSFSTHSETGTRQRARRSPKLLSNRKNLQHRMLRMETEEPRQMLAGGPLLVSILPNTGDLLNNNDVRHVAPRELTFRFNDGQVIDPASLGGTIGTSHSGIIISRSADGTFGNADDVQVPYGFIGLGDHPNEVVVRFASNLPDDLYRIVIKGDGPLALKNEAGEEFNMGVDSTPINFDLDLGPQVVAVVPQPVTGGNGAALSQAKNVIDVYFNADTLLTSSAQNRNFYKLIHTKETATSADDTVILPTTAQYFPAENRVRLTFASSLDTLPGAGTGTFRLQIGEHDASQPIHDAPQLINSGADVNNLDSSFATAFNLSTLTAKSKIVSASIDAQAFPIVLPGGNDEPGHRDIPAELHIDPLLVGFGDTAAGIPTIKYNFRTDYGFDPNNLPLSNVITEPQRQRTREVFELYAHYLGVNFVETANEGLVIATGDPRAINPLIPTGAGGVAGLAGPDRVNFRPTAIMDNAENWGESEFGGTWFRTAMHEIGHLLGLGHSTDLPAVTIMGEAEDGTYPNGEPVFPGDHDIVHGQHLYRPDSKDIDVYKFTLNADGLFSAETIAERASSFSSLDSVLTLYKAVGSDFELVARNDNYYSKDSYLELQLTAGTYYVAVTSTGNTQFDPRVDDSGFGGTTQGAYDLRLNFSPSAASQLRDTTGTSLDGDADGAPGGTYNFWFRAQTDANTIFVDKQGPTNPSGALGSATNPYKFIPDALAAASVGSIVRIVGNGAVDADPLTPDTALPYEIGVQALNANADLPDGEFLQVPRGVTVMVDAGALFKLRRGSIRVGSFTQGIDQSMGAFQVLGTPVKSVFFASHNDESIGIDPDIGLPTSPSKGNWGGISFKYDLDRATGGTIANATNAGPIVITTDTPHGLQSGQQVRITGVRGNTAANGNFNVNVVSPTTFQLVGSVGNGAYVVSTGDRWSRQVHENEGIFLNYVNHAYMTHGGGGVDINGVTTVIDPVDMQFARPTVTHNTIILSADAAISADPNSFEDSKFQSSLFTANYDRIGPEINNNTLYREVEKPGGQIDGATNAVPIEITTAADHGLVDGQRVRIRGVQGNTAANGDFTIDVTGARTFQLLQSDGNAVYVPSAGDTYTVLQGIDNSINGLLVRIRTAAGGPLKTLDLPARFNDTDITHILPENLVIRGTPGGPFDINARLDARLAVGPGMVVKLDGSRIETMIGGQFIAEGTALNKAVFTAMRDDRFGGSGTFDTNGDDFNPLQDPPGTIEAAAAPGQWGGIYFGPLSHGSLDETLITFGGGDTAIEGGFSPFNAVEIRQAQVRIANSTLEFNAGGQSSGDRHGLGVNAPASIFVRGAQPVIVNNIIRDSAGDAININVNALNSQQVVDFGRSTGSVNAYRDFDNNFGPLVRLNRMARNNINGMVVRGGTMTTQGVWDDSDIVHVVFDEIIVPNHHTYSGLRLQSSPESSLVVKLQGNLAGITANGTPLDIDDRIGGTVQVLGFPTKPVVLTSTGDDTVGAGLDPEGRPQNDTDGDGVTTTLPTGPEVDRGTTIDNDVLSATVGHFGATITAGGEASNSEATAQGLNTLFTNADWIFAYRQFIDVNRDGGGIPLSSTTVTTPPTLVSPDRVFSAGNFQGVGGAQVNWTAESFIRNGDTLIETRINLTSQSALGNLRLINYLDEDINSVSDDLLYVFGQPGTKEYQAFTLDGPERVGFSQGGVYTAGPELTNASWDGWAADEFNDLETAIRTGGTTYTPAGNIDLNDLTPFNDPSLGQVYGLADVTTAFAWSTVPTANSATITTYLRLIPSDPSLAGTWRSVKLDKYSNDRNVRVENEREPSKLLNVAGSNDSPAKAQTLGILAPSEKDGDDIQRLGFEVHGYIALDKPSDVDVYTFDAKSGTEVWLDIDRTSQALDTLLELVQADGTVIARSDDSLAENAAGVINFKSPVINPNAQTLQRDTWNGTDLYTTNTHDAGFRVVLPGAPNTVETYYVRVRSKGANINNLAGGKSRGAYQLQIRLRELDEVPGSTVRYSDIRFASTGIEVLGMPGHSHILSEAGETRAVHNTIGTAQPLGNLLTADRGSLAVGGKLDTATQVDFYTFDLNYDLIQSIAQVNNGDKTWSTIFDIDYADGIARPDTTLSVFDENFQLILISRDSNVADDQPGPLEGDDIDDISRGSVGTQDPFIGPAQLPEGATRRYYVAISSNATLPQAVNAYFQGAAANSQIRLEPVNSQTRVVEDHIGFSGRMTATAPAPIFKGTTPVQLNTYARPFELDDLSLYVVTNGPGGKIRTVDPYTGVVETDVTQGSSINGTGFGYGDLAMRNDGLLFGFTYGTDDDNSGNFVRIDPGTGTETNLGDDGIDTYQFDTGNPPSLIDHNVGVQFEALDYCQDPNSTTRSIYAVGNRSGVPTGSGTGVPAGPNNSNLNNTVYLLHPDTGFVQGKLNLAQAFTDALPRGNIITSPITGIGIRAVNGSNFSDGERFRLNDGGLDVVFEFDIGDGVLPGSRAVQFTPAPSFTATQVANAINTAILNTPELKILTSVDVNNGIVRLGGPLVNFFPDLTALTQTNVIVQSGLVTGIVCVGNSAAGWAVDNSGGFYQWADTPFGITSSKVMQFPGVQFSGLTEGPLNLKGGIYQNVMFATTSGGEIIAIDTGSPGTTQFQPEPIFAHPDPANPGQYLPGFSRISTGIGGATGLAFSPIDYNLWHVTDHRNTDQGHGINASFDESRNTLPANVTQGGRSFYFGLEDPLHPLTVSNQPGSFPFRTNTSFSYQTYNTPNGAHGSLVTDSFSLAGSTSDDRPTLYFNYFLASEDAAGNTINRAMRDAARVFASPDEGRTWVQLATNNSVLSQDKMQYDAELPGFLSDSERASTSDLFARQRIQLLHDNTGWRQARVSLGEFAGMPNVKLRFDFATSGVVQDPSAPRAHDPNSSKYEGGFLSDLTGKNIGVDANRGGLNNNFEGFYIDDIIVGFAERGEMVTQAPATPNPTGFFNVPVDPAPDFTQVLTGAYQLEVRRGTEYALTASGTSPNIILTHTFDHNDRLSESISLTAPVSGNAFDQTKTVFDSLAFGSNPSISFTNVPAAATGAVLDITINADLGINNEFVTLNAEGVLTTNLYATGQKDPGVIDSTNLNGPFGMTFAPDGNLIVSSNLNNLIRRFFGGHGGYANNLPLGTNQPRGMTIGPDGRLYVADRTQDRVLVFNFNTGVTNTYVVSSLGGLNDPTDLVFDAAGDLYVTSAATNSVFKYRGPAAAVPGQLISQFVSNVPALNGGLNNPFALLFHPVTGNLLVSSAGTNEVLQYNKTTGAFINAFVTAASGGLSNPAGIAFAPDGSLFVASRGTNEVLRYSGLTGAFVNTPVNVGEGGLNQPMEILFQGGDLYVASFNNDVVLRYSNLGAFKGTFSGGETISTPRGAVFGPDGHLYVTDDLNNSIHRYDGTTGEFLNAFVPGGSGGLVAPESLTFGPDGNLYVASRTDNTVRFYSGATGENLGIFVTAGAGGLNGPSSMVFNAAGQLLIASRGSNNVLRYSSAGAFLNVFASNAALTAPEAMAFGTGGDLFVTTSNAANRVLRFNGSTGAFIGAFVTAAGSGGLVTPNGLTFGPGGDLFVSDASGGSPGEVYRYNGSTGAFAGPFPFVRPQSTGGLVVARNILFDPSSSFLYAVNSAGNNVLRYRASDGNFDRIYSPVARTQLQPRQHTFSIQLTQAQLAAMLASGPANTLTFTFTPSEGVHQTQNNNFITARLRYQAAASVNGQFFDVNDGLRTVRFEFDTGDGLVNAGAVAINVLPTDSQADIALKMAQAINTQHTLGLINTTANALANGFENTGSRVDLNNVARVTKPADPTNLNIGILVHDRLIVQAPFPAPPPLPYLTHYLGDRNLVREQGQILIEGNRITEVSQYGILVDAAARDANGSQPHAGAPSNQRKPDNQRLVPGVTLVNNQIVGATLAGIRFSGDPNAGNDPLAAVPFGRILNNTVFGSLISHVGVGIQVDENASPTVLNNVVSNLGVGIQIDGSSATTNLGTTFYDNNALHTQTPATIGAGSFPIFTTNTLAQPNLEPVFTNAAGGNFYPAPGAKLIDASRNSLQERPELSDVRLPLGILDSSILAPLTDLIGQFRRDDPLAQDFAGLGSDIFKDRGAIDRADFDLPTAKLTNPLDNDLAGLDEDPTANKVVRSGATLLDFSLQLSDGSAGSGIDDTTVSGARFTLTRNGVLLVEGADYFVTYDATNDVVRFIPVQGVWSRGAVYVISVDNTQATGIKDIAGNPIQPNDATGVTQFKIILPSDFPPILSIEPVSMQVVEGTGGTTNLVFTVNALGVSAQNVSVNFATSNVTAVAGAAGDYTARSGTLVFLPGDLSKTITVPINPDFLDEVDETFRLTLSNVINGSINPAAGVGTGIIVDDDGPGIGIGDVQVVEGTGGTKNAVFNVTLGVASVQTVTVNFATAPGIPPGAASAGADFTTTSGLLTFAPGDLFKTISVPLVTDSIDEVNETFFVNLTNPVNAIINDNQAIGTIIDDDGPNMSIANTSVIEGNSGTRLMTYTVTLSAPSPQVITANFATQDGTATAGQDYQAVNGTLTFNPGVVTQQVQVVVNGDTVDEQDETVLVNLSTITNANGVITQATGVIRDDDDPTLTITDINFQESLAGTGGTALANITVTLSNATFFPVTANFSTTAGTAAAGVDYNTTSGLLTIPAGNMSGIIQIPILGDIIDEFDEYFDVVLSNIVNAAPIDSQARVTIVDDDAASTIEIAEQGVIVLEKNVASTTKVFTVQLNKASGKPITVLYQTKNGPSGIGGAVGGLDFTSTSGVLDFAVGETVKNVSVVVLADTLDETDEVFSLEILPALVNNNVTIAPTGVAQITIDDDDGPVLTATDAQVNEGGNLVFTLTLSSPSPQDVVVDVVTSNNGSALAGQDYTAMNFFGTVVPAGQTSVTVSVPTTNDSLDEVNETFLITLSNIRDGSIGTTQAVGTIIDNDGPNISVTGSKETTEGSTGLSDFVVTLSLDNPSPQTVSVNYATSDGTAIAGTDYQSKNGTVSFAPGETSKTITLRIIGDSQTEPNDENFFLNLSNPVNGFLGPNQSQTSLIIHDDDLPVITVNDITVTEQNTVQIDATFTVSLSFVGLTPITVTVQTLPDSALAGKDFVPLPPTVLTFAPGERDKFVSVKIVPDRVAEAPASFRIKLSNAGGANLGPDTEGSALILDNDPPPTPTIGLWDRNTGFFRLRNTNNTGNADLTYLFGPGSSPFIPLAGDWDGNGSVTVGLYVPQSGEFLLRNSHSTGNADIHTVFGPGGGSRYFPIVGDWDGNGTDTVGLYDLQTGVVLQRNINAFTNPNDSFASNIFQIGSGEPFVFPIVGDWDGNGIDTLGIYYRLTGVFRERNINGYDNSQDVLFNYGAPLSSNPNDPNYAENTIPVAGDWNADNIDTVGLYRRNSSLYQLRNANSTGPADLTFVYGSGGTNAFPIAGDWNGSNGQLLTLSSSEIVSSAAASVTQRQIKSLADSAIARWAAAGLADAGLQQLRGLRYEIADLSGSQLALHQDGVVYIDRNAAGHGWFVDRTPGQDQEFVYSGETFVAKSRTLARRVDLLSVLSHEMGHELGLDHTHGADIDLMAESINLGERRLPEADLVGRILDEETDWGIGH